MIDLFKAKYRNRVSPSGNSFLKPSPGVAGGSRVNVPFDSFTLSNGLTVILRKESSIPVVAVDVAYHVGSKNELRGRTGLAHLFEHLMFEGSANVKKGEFDTYISLAGGYNNAYTTEDVTNYYEVLPSNQLPLALWLESDRMLKFAATVEALTTQREVVKEEKRWRVDNRPYGDATEKLQEMVFPVGQYNWPVIGSMADLDSARLNDLKDFFELHYRPDNAVLVISGDIDLRKTKKLASKYFEDIPAGSKPLSLVDFDDLPISSEKHLAVSGKVPSPAVFVAYKAPPEGSAEYYALSQLSKVLSDGNSSRLYKKLLYEKQTVSEFDASIDGMEESSVFIFSAFVSSGHSIEEVVEIFDSEIKKLQNSRVSDREFRKARNSSLSSYVGKLSTNSGVADALAHYHTFFGDPGMISSEVERELGVTRDSMLRTAVEILDKNKRAVLSYLPEINS